ncbi:SDR family oxidoreductase [soil metagenome]
MTFDLSGKRALITGASSGLGAHFARVLIAAGAEVVLAARRLDALEELARQLRAVGGLASVVTLDVSDPGSVGDALQCAGSIDILVNNAGVARSAPLLDEAVTDIDAVLNTNLRGSLLVAIATARHMREHGVKGTIINIASILGLRQGGQVSSYAISKAGVIQATKQLALELARHGIRVNALAPGYIATDLNAEFFETAAGQALIQRIPQRRLGALSDLDGPLLLLASEASRFMTGSVVTVDGGHMVSSL